MYDRFTETARDVMKAANQEAMRVNHEYIGTDDILVGLAVGETDSTSRLITSHVSVEAIRDKLAEMRRIEGAKTWRAKKIVESAMGEARRLFHLEIGTEHLLLGLLSDASSDASRALSELGIDLEQLKTEVLSHLPPGSPEVVQQRQSNEERFAEHPEVADMKREIERLQRELYKAVLERNFQLAASIRDERRVVERSLSELYRKLSEG